MSGPELRHVADEVAPKLGLVVQGFCGKGAFKETYRVETSEGSVAALKIVDRARISEVRTDREIEALARCESSSIAKLVGRCNHKANDGNVYDIVIEEFLDGGSLQDKMRNQSFSPSAILGLAIGLVTAVKELHRLQLVHRDIKPANIMFRSDRSDPVLVQCFT
jgi:serine/threonine protein kinase